MGRFNNSRMAVSAAVLSLAVVAAGCTTTAPSERRVAGGNQDDLNSMLVSVLAGESQTTGAELDRRIADAAAYPLGSKENPVRAQGPSGQRAYLSRLRCSDTSRPSFNRMGSAGMSPYDNIVDIYQVTCANGASPASSEIWMDMYHRGHVENDPVPGYGIAGGRTSTAPAK